MKNGDAFPSIKSTADWKAGGSSFLRAYYDGLDHSVSIIVAFTDEKSELGVVMVFWRAMEGK